MAGARPDAVPGAYLLPGAGLDGGGAEPNWEMPLDQIHGQLAETLEKIAEDTGQTPDPMVESCERDLRPSDYAAEYAQRARRLLLGEDDTPRPAWWQALRDQTGVERAPVHPARGFTQLLA